jgi:hypothetical protein
LNPKIGDTSDKWEVYEDQRDKKGLDTREKFQVENKVCLVE